jgi:hypothetical protein
VALGTPGLAECRGYEKNLGQPDRKRRIKMDTTSMRSLRDVLAFPFREPNWKGRFAIGAALCLAGFLIPFIPVLFVYGYLLHVMRQAIRDESLALPAWEAWGTFFLDGLKSFAVGLVYILPSIVVFGVGMWIYFIGMFSFAGMSDSYASSAANDPAFWLILGSMGVFFLSMLLGSLLWILGVLPLPMAAGNLASTDRLSSAFRLRELWNILAANPFGYFLAWVIVLGLFTLVYVATMLPYMTLVLICLIPVVASLLGYYLLLVAAALFGLTYREARIRLAEAGIAAQG